LGDFLSGSKTSSGLKPEPDSTVELKVRALRYLMRREHSRAELARKLAPYADSAESLAAVLADLASRKQLSDERYAEVRAHGLARKYGAAKIRQDLKAHGVADAIVERVSNDGEEERARAILARKYRTVASTAEEKARRARFLQGRGFSYHTIRRALVLTDGE
jgi:regulatory protein